MKKLHKLVVFSYIGPFIVTFLLMIFILLMQFLWTYVDEMMGKGISWTIIAELLFYACASLVTMALPIAVLLSSIMTFGNLGERNELTAIKSSGISLFRAMLPLITFVGMISIGAFFFSNNVWPLANLKFKSLLYDVRNKKPAFNIDQNVWYNGIDGVSFYVKKKDPDGKTIRNVWIYDHTEKEANFKKKEHRKIKAEYGVMNQSEDGRYLVLDLYNGTIYENGTDDFRNNGRDRTFPHRTYDFESMRKVIDLSSFQMQHLDQNLFKHHDEMKNLYALSHSIDSLKNTLAEKRKINHRYFENNLILLRDSIMPDFDTIVAAEIHFEDLDYPEQRKSVSIAQNIVKNQHQYLSSTIVNTSGNLENKIRGHKIEWHKKFTLSVACMILFFIGAPLGSIVKKGGIGMPVILSLIFFIVYYVLTLTFEKLAEAQTVSPAMGMWFPSAILFPIGLFLTYKAVKDSQLFNQDRYIKFFERLLHVLRIRKLPN